GGSHAQHWLPALEEIARQRRWRVVNLTKAACLFTGGPQTYKGKRYTACEEWNRNAMAELGRLKPDIVFTTSTTTARDRQRGYTEELVVDGYVDRWRELGRMGIDVVAIRDTPRMGFNVPECLAESEPEECTAPSAKSLAAVSPLKGLTVPANVTTLDLTHVFCRSGECPSVIGNLIVYWDDSHVGKTFMRTLAPEFERQLTEAEAQAKARARAKAKARERRKAGAGERRQP
ncbi:SGNH hydrolase domain-containing protein, partial [Actinomadura adrarensis]